jgi:DNA recombination protein RmuC
MPMDAATLLSAAAALFSLAALLAVLLRRPPAPARDTVLDAAVERLHAAQERQGQQLASLPADLRAEVALRTGEVAEKLTAQVLDQTKALNATLAEQARHQGEAAAALKRDLATVGGELKTGVETVKTALAEGQAQARQALAADMTNARDLIERKATESREQVEAKLKEMREANDARLAEIQKTVNEQLHAAVEKQMGESFNRVIDQFTAVQKAMGDVAAVTGQIGDLKRLFSNVKTRGGWGETQVKAVLDDFLPEGSYETNVKLREGSNETVEFAILMPTPGETPVRLPVDAKFPVEDYERLLAAQEARDAEAEAQARRGLETRIRGEAAKIAQKYLNPPATTEFGVMYLPTEGLYAEVARIPGLIDEVGRKSRVFVAGPSLLPAMLRTIQLGHVTLALSRNAESVRELLAATKAEMAKMDGVLERLGKNVGTMSNTIGDARTRTRAIARKLKGLEALPGEQAAALLGVEGEIVEDDETA